MKNRIAIIVMAFALALSVAGAALADTPSSNTYPFAGPDNVKALDIIGFRDSWGNANGGEFVVQNFTQPGNTAFSTFCVQTGEYLQFLPNNTFKVTGISSQVLLATGNSTKDNLQTKTAFLYSQFRAGTLPSFDYLNAQLKRNADADLLQRAIWQFQGQVTTETAANNKYVAYANTSAWTSGIGDVRVLNIVWDTNNQGYQKGAAAQDVLTIVAIPEPVFFQFGAMMGLGGLGVFRRRRA